MEDVLTEKRCKENEGISCVLLGRKQCESLELTYRMEVHWDWRWSTIPSPL